MALMSLLSPGVVLNGAFYKDLLWTNIMHCRSGDTPSDITEDPKVKERLVELAEQRLCLARPSCQSLSKLSTIVRFVNNCQIRVRRRRNSHSIRRTSLRDKMKITKKDVAGEGLIHMQGVSRMAEDNPNTDED